MSANRVRSPETSKRPGYILFLLLAWGALSFGAVYPWAYWPLAAGCAALGGWAVLSTEAWRDPRSTGLGLALIFVAAAMCVQLLPLPSGLVALLSPSMTPFFAQYRLGYTMPSFLPLTVEPSDTWIVIGLFVALALLLVGLSRSLRSVPLPWLMHALMALGVTLAIIGIVQKALIDEVNPLVYGFWKPRDGGRVFGPYINRNHFAGWMVMALPLVIGYSCGVVGALRPPRGRTLRDGIHWASGVEANRFILAAVSILVMGAALVMTQSRSGMLAFASGVAVIAGFVMVRAKKPAVRFAALGYFGLLLVGAVALTGAGSTVNRFAQASADVQGRLGAWHDALRIISDFPIAGTGMGTFARAMLVYQSGPRQLMYAQAHNDYLQLAAEGGALVVVPALVTIGLLIQGIRRRLAAGDDDTLTSWVRAGAIAALVAIAVQSSMEFSLQMPGNTVMFVFVAALAMHRPRRSGRANRI